MAGFNGEVLKLREGHTWNCKPGYKIFVLDQGLLRFDVPEDWFMEPGETSARFYDRKPPDDECRLEVSLIRHPSVDWSRLPLDQLVPALGYGRSSKETLQGGVHRQSRPGLDLVWVENSFTDPNEHKPAISRIAIARGTSGHALITLDFWEADSKWVLPAWEEVMHSVDMGLKVQDPTVGEQRM